MKSLPAHNYQAIAKVNYLFVIISLKKLIEICESTACGSGNQTTRHKRSNCVHTNQIKTKVLDQIPEGKGIAFYYFMEK